MAQVSFTSFYNGPFAVYPSATGLVDSLTGAPQLGGDFLQGNYCDIDLADARVWNQQYGSTLFPGRYRIVQLSASSTAANTGVGKPLAFARGTTVQRVVVNNAGTGYTNGTFSVASSTSGGTRAATAQVVVSGGLIISAQLTNPGVGFTATPTFSLSELSGGSGASVLAQLTVNTNVLSTFDAAAAELSDVRGVMLGAVTAAQITAGAWVVMQELGIASVNVTAGTSIAAGGSVAATTGAVVTAAAAATAIPVGFFGYLLDATGATAPSLVRVALRTPVVQG